MKIILFEGEIETLGFFSRELKKAFEKYGHTVMMFDFEHIGESAGELLRFCEKGKTVMLCFNFHGISGESFFRDEEGNYLWDDLQIPCFNIVVDHPLCYHRFIENRPQNYVQLCIDRNHIRYMNRFFPEVVCHEFLPLGGTSITGAHYLPIRERPLDISFTGNYVPLSVTEKYIHQNGSEYAAFYQGLIGKMIREPERTLEDAAEEHIRTEMGGATAAELKDAMANLIFIDVHIRNMVRGHVIKALAENGIKIHVFGRGWDSLECRGHENIIEEGPKDSLECLKCISQSKLSLNVMPWFKDGAHDRIFNSMLNGAVCVTDSSVYLDSILEDDTNVIKYSLYHGDEQVERITALLRDTDKMQQIADKGFLLASENHTWEKRAEQLLPILEASLSCAQDSFFE